MYVERRARGELAEVVQCTWTSLCEQPGTRRIVPDACTDIIWNGRSLFVAGPDTGPVFQALEPGDCHVAVRFATGKNGLLGAPASALRDARAALAELWGDPARALEEQLLAAPDARTAGEALERAVRMQLRAAAPADPLVQELVRVFRAAVDVQPSVGAVAAELGITERQLLRRCNAALGYGPKLLARILRFQRFMACVRGTAGRSRNLADIAQACGYADQAHLAHETSELAGAAPSTLRDEQGVSDFDKPAASDGSQDVEHDDDRRDTTRAS